jgi:predicted transcriptional regulator
MRVQGVMTKTVASCRPEANLAAATALMWEHSCGLLPVVYMRRSRAGAHLPAAA